MHAPSYFTALLPEATSSPPDLRYSASVDAQYRSLRTHYRSEINFLASIFPPGAFEGVAFVFGRRVYSATMHRRRYKAPAETNAVEVMVVTRAFPDGGNWEHCRGTFLSFSLSSSLSVSYCWEKLLAMLLLTLKCTVYRTSTFSIREFQSLSKDALKN